MSPRSSQRDKVEREAAPDAIKLLKNQHREVEALFEELEKTSDRSFKKRETLFEEIARKLTHHAKIEEKIFYPEGKEVDEDLTLEAYEEHDVMKHLISKIRRTDSKDETYMAKITVLKEVVEHHVKEEENEYFPKCKKDWSSEELDELGEEMQKLYDRLEAKLDSK
ncbi:MAG: hemerythrin domain-containing protein [Proteobacteria bacterium]|nr:MAG: hemerythrin domain-containing protein [Pseudomonadota bacterium]